MNQSERLPKVLPTVLILALGWLLASPGIAIDTPGWTLRVASVWVDTDLGESRVDTGNEDVTAFAEGHAGLSISGEYRFSPRVGLELGLLGAANVVGVRVGHGGIVATDTLVHRTFSVGVNFHLTPSRRADVYIGPFLGHVSYTDVGFFTGDDHTGVRIGDDFTLGAVLGVDLPIGKGGWIFCTSLRYLDSDLDLTDDNGDRFGLKFDPVAFGIGFGYRF